MAAREGECGQGVATSCQDAATFMRFLRDAVGVRF
jgi:hypothetical protein